MSREQGGITGAWYSGAWWLWLLRPLELLFRLVTFVRRSLYRLGLLKVYRPDKPVVVVGNITVGGTGKTPVVIALVEALQAAGLRPGVVSRGYGATGGLFPHWVSVASSAADCGDEPLLIFRRTGCPCVVSPSRPDAVRALLTGTPVDVVISDDGLQHYALARDMEIAVVDARRGTGNGFCLPAGPLREPRSRLESVDFVLYRGGDEPDVAVRYELDGLVNIVSGERRALAAEAFPGPVNAVAGIGQPEQFFHSLRAAGLDVEPHVFPDHHVYSAADLSPLGDRPIIMTEKDAVKCAAIAGNNAWYLQMSARLPDALVRAVVSLATP
jgi:tetraacyldisaccharide 4'-kinase